MNDECIFCKIIAGEAPADRIYENEKVLVFANIKPNNLGHALVVPKAHFPNIYELPDEELGPLMEIVKKVAKNIKETLHADGVNVIMNNDKAAGQVVFHTHIHIIPRFENDPFTHWKPGDFTPEQIHETAEKLKKSFT